MVLGTKNASTSDIILSLRMYQSVIFLVLVTRAIKKSVCIASGEVDIILSLLFAKKPIKSEPPDVI